MNYTKVMTIATHWWCPWILKKMDINNFAQIYISSTSVGTTGHRAIIFFLATNPMIYTNMLGEVLTMCKRGVTGHAHA